MSQLLDKADLLSVELSRTKKLVNLMEMKLKSQAPLCSQRPIMAIKFQNIVDQTYQVVLQLSLAILKKKKKPKT